MKAKATSINIVSNIPTKCPQCSRAVEPRKLHRPWERTEAKGIFAHHPTDIMFCIECRLALVLSVFSKLRDQHGDEWAVDANRSYLNAQTSAHSMKKKRNEKSNSNSKVSHNSNKIPKTAFKSVATGSEDYFIADDSPKAVRKGPIVTYGSPRSRYQSPLYDSAGRFLGSSSPRRRDEYD